MLEKTMYINQLLAIYMELLTPKQKEMMRLYYQEDWSLGEIADQYEVSRQAVNDTIKRSEKTLLHYEEVLGNLERSNQRALIYRQLLDTEDLEQVHQTLDQLLQQEYQR
ncbi:YlxM family DNA-binding protein [Hutsoniella sourekii]|uniref:YlxM family DNA-binding protein n=1 Tax=Hutsoniella sourekii TaxID=87650 RepID=UPI000486A567|nr:YlxM family DNA-binding protein [Hutsoniella sourekii]